MHVLHLSFTTGGPNSRCEATFPRNVSLGRLWFYLGHASLLRLSQCHPAEGLVGYPLCTHIPSLFNYFPIPLDLLWCKEYIKLQFRFV